MARVHLARVAYSAVYGLLGKPPKKREIRPPLGLLTVASYFDNVKIFDGEVCYPNPLPIQELANCDILGFTVTTPEYIQVLRVVRQCRQINPNLTIMLGGAHCNFIDYDCKHLGIDFVFKGESEYSLPGSPSDKDWFTLLNDTVFCKHNICNNNAWDNIYKQPAWHLVDLNDYRYYDPQLGFLRMGAVETSRGCPYACSYCFRPHGDIVKYKPVDTVLDEIEALVKVYNAQLIGIFDDTFTAKKSRVLEICNGIHDRKIKCKFYCFTRANHVDIEVIKEMKRAGFDKMTMGVESGVQRILDMYGKKLTLDKIEKAYKILNDMNIETRASFIIGSPTETKEDIMQSIRFAKKIGLKRVGWNILTPYPGSKIYCQAKAGNGLKLLTEDFEEYKRWGTSVIETDTLSKTEIEDMQKEAIMRFWTQPYVIWYHIKQFVKGRKDYFYYRPLVQAIRERVKSWVSQ